jgi:hypothetical protein
MTTKHEDLIEMTTLKKYTVTSQNCVKPLVDLDHGTMFVFPDQAEKLCIVCNDMSGNYSWVEITTGNTYRFPDLENLPEYANPVSFVQVNPVSNFSAQITLA